MIQRLVLLSSLIVVLGFAGCGSGSRAVEVVIEGDGQFPEFLVGRWKADKHSWEFVFEADGTISSAVIALGAVTMKPGETSIVPMVVGGKGIFEPGPWLVHYSPASRELMVEVSLKHFYAEMAGAVMEGKVRDVLVGEIAGDGKSWQADWNSFPEYFVTTHAYRNYKLPADPNDNPQATLIFEKVVPE